ncbi:hypothetical protein AB6D11_03115 [Vibrio splendidus]
MSIFAPYTDCINMVSDTSQYDDDLASGITSMTWDDLVARLLQHDVRLDKDGPGFIPATPKPVNDWIAKPSLTRLGEEHTSYRVDENFDSICVAVFDLDSKGALDAAKIAFSELECVYYSTHSYSAEKPYKARVAIKLEVPLQVKDWHALMYHITLAIEIDENCKNISRSYRYPSISPNAGITPLAHYQAGRPLNIEEAKRIGATYPREISEELHNAVKRRYGMAEFSKSRLHYSGVEIPNHYRTNQEAKYDYESLKTRHESRMSELDRTDARHPFSRDVINDEVRRFGARVDIVSVVQFLFLSTQHHGSKGLEGGNTPEELPTLWLSSYNKMANDLMDSQGKFKKTVLKQITEGINLSMKALQDGQWSFEAVGEDDTSLTIEKLTPSHLNSNPDYAINELRSRWQGLYQSLLVDKDIPVFIEKVLNLEIERSSSGYEVPLERVAECVCLCIKTACRDQGYTRKEVVDLIRNADHTKVTDDECMVNFCKSAFEFGIARLEERMPWTVVSTRTPSTIVTAAP